MDYERVQIIAGFASSLIFAGGTFPMLFKAVKTKDLRSYSLANITLSNVGNFIYWLYVVTLPVGPIWYLHGFFTITTALMLLLYLRYETGKTGPTLYIVE